MLSILVCHSYFLRFDEKQRERAKPYPPLATLQVASMLRAAGHRVTFFDAMLAGGLDEYRAKFRAARPDVVVIYEDNYNFLSKMCLGKMRDACCEMIATARSGGARVVARFILFAARGGQAAREEAQAADAERDVMLAIEGDVGGGEHEKRIARDTEPMTGNPP